MVSIQYGGGPSMEQRQAFCNPPEGSHIPGYLGFVPQVKFETGKTFARETHHVSKKLPYYFGPRNASVKHYYPEVGKRKDGESRRLFQDEIVLKKLPIPTGDNKYTEKMMPGYSGDIPRALYKFGATYRAVCDDAVHEFIEDYERAEANNAHLERMATMFPALRPISGDPRVRDHMNLWLDTLTNNKKLVGGGRRDFYTETSIPGYTGYIPRQYNTELGLGARFHEVNKKCVESFKTENDQHFKKLDMPMEIKDNTYTVQEAKPLSIKAPSEPSFTRRIFTQDGMRPGYTGHIHGATNMEGYTYGDTSRQMEVCKHSFPCYGDYIKNIDLAVN